MNRHDSDVRDLPLQSFHKVDVVNTTAANDQFAEIRGKTRKRRADCGCAELGECSLYVGCLELGRICQRQCLRQPVGIKFFEARAFWRRFVKKRIFEEPGEQYIRDASTTGPVATFVKGLVAFGTDPAIKQRVARTRIESCHLVQVLVQNRNVRDAADIDDSTRTVFFRKKPLMKSGGKWRAFAAQRDIGSSKVGNRRNPGTDGDDIRIAKLKGKRALGAWLMANSLPVTTDSLDGGRWYRCTLQEFEHGITKTFTNPLVHCTEFIDIAPRRVAAVQ